MKQTKQINFLMWGTGLVLVGIAGAIRYPYLFLEGLWPDEALYGWYAQKIFADPVSIFSKEVLEFHPPLFSLLISLLHFLFTPELAGQVTLLLFSLAGIVTIYLLGRKIGGRFIGFFCAVSLTFNYVYISTGSRRILRYYTGIEFEEFSGRLTAFPESKKQFINIVRASKVPVVLAIDRWEYTQPEWIYPMTEEKLDFLRQQNFELRKTIKRQRGDQETEVILLLVKEPNTSSR